MIYPVKPIDLSIPSVGITSPQYQSDYQIDGFSTERSGNLDKPENSFGGGAFCYTYQDAALNWFVAGGAVRVSDTTTFQVPPWPFTITEPFADRLLYIEVNVEVNRTDDGDYFMSGIKTGLDASLVIDDDLSISSYPLGSAPILSSGAGKIVLALGLLKVVDGVPNFHPTGCGSFILEHCNGNLTHRAR